MHAILQHFYFKAPLFHYKTLLVYDYSIRSSESPSDRTSPFKIEIKMSFDCLDTLLSPREVAQLSWKVLLTEAKTQFSIQKCKVRVCRIMKIAVKKARCLSKNSR